MKQTSLIFRACCKVNFRKVNLRFFHEKIYVEDITALSEKTIKDQLKTFSIQFSEGYTCLHVKNCFCGRSKTNFANTADVFINKRTGFFMCECCKLSGDWNAYSTLLTKAVVEKVDVEPYKKDLERYDRDFVDWNEVVDKTECLKYHTDRNCRNIFDEFRLTPCSRSVVEKLNIRISLDKNTLYFPLYVSGYVVGYKTLSKDGEENVSPKIHCPGLLTPEADSKCFNSTAATAAVVVANIPDFLALVSLNLLDYNVICLPYGAAYLSQMSLPFFEKYDKIILWMGERCLEATANISKKFYEKRCYVVRPTENQKSATIALLKKQDIKNILSESKLTYHQYVTTFNSLRDDVLAELQNQVQVVGVPWTKFPSLTKILKGHRRGELTILTGPTGVGKTTFLSEYSLDLAMQGVYTLWGSFEIKNIRLAKILLTQFAQAPLPNLISEYNALCDRFEQLPIFFLTFHGQQSLSNVMDAVYHCSYTYDIAHVIIDNVQFMIEVAPDSSNLDRFWKQDYMIQMFRSFASKNNCHVTLVMHPKKIEGIDLSISSIFGGVKASQEADNVLIMQKKEINSYVGRKYLQIAKNRYSGDLGSIPLYFDRPSLSFYEKCNFYRNHQLQEEGNDGLNEKLDDNFFEREIQNVESDPSRSSF